MFTQTALLVTGLGPTSVRDLQMSLWETITYTISVRTFASILISKFLYTVPRSLPYVDQTGCGLFHFPII